MTEEERKEKHKNFIIKLITSYIKGGTHRLSSISEQTATYPINEFGEEEFRAMLKKAGYSLTTIKDYLIFKIHQKDKSKKE